MAVEVRVRAAFMAAGWGMPTVCALHGEPAVEHRKTGFRSDPPVWTYPLFAFGVIGGLLAVALSNRKFVRAPAWPLCARCSRARKIGLRTGLALFVVAVLVAVVLSQVLPDDQGWIAVLAAFVPFIAAAFFTDSGAKAANARGKVTYGGQVVEFRKVDERFAAQIAAAEQFATEHYAGQRQAVQQDLAAREYAAQQQRTAALRADTERVDQRRPGYLLPGEISADEFSPKG